MPRGGARAGAGRKKGIPNRRSVVSLRVLLSGKTPLDVLLESMRQLFDAGEYLAAAMVASRAAPFVHQRFAATEKPAAMHPAQVIQGDLFDAVQTAEGSPDATADAEEWDRLLPN